MVFAHEGNGRLRQLQTHDLAPAGFQGKVGAGALHLSADGRFSACSIAATTTNW